MEVLIQLFCLSVSGLGGGGYNAAMALQMQQQQQIMMQQRAAAMAYPNVSENQLTHYAKMLYDSVSILVGRRFNYVVEACTADASCLAYELL